MKYSYILYSLLIENYMIVIKLEVKHLIFMKIYLLIHNCLM